MDKKQYSRETKILVQLAKKTHNMPTLTYAVEMVRKWRLSKPNVYSSKETTFPELINALYKTTTEQGLLKGDKLEENFVKIMDNWKNFRRIYVTI